jgi:hypothetical protein
LTTSADGANNDRIRARGDIIGARESLMGDLSKDRDASERSKLDALGVNSRFGDSQLLDFAGKQLKAASGEEEARNVRTAASDAFSRSLSDRDQDRRDRDDDLASSADQERRSDNVFRRDTLGQADEADRAKYTDHLQSLGVAQDYDYRSAKGLDDLGMDASRDEIARDQFRFAAARGASDEQNAEQDGLDKLGAAADSANLAGAQAASDENRANFNTTFSAAMRSGDTRAMIESIRSAAENSVLTNADMTEINIALQRAGVDAETRASIGADIRQSVKDGAAIYAGLPPAAAVEAAPSAIPKAKPNPF